MSHARTLAAGAALAVVVLVVTHPVAVAALLALAWVLARSTGAFERAAYLGKLAFGIAVSVALLNALFSWNGTTELWRAPFRIALLGRPRLTLEAIAWGIVAGGQLAATVLAVGAATLAVPPESLHKALVAIGLPTPVATAGSLALRLAPDTARDAQAMRRALHTRGVSTAGVRGASHVLVPLTARSLDRALVAEEALVLRGYDTNAPGARARVPLLLGLAAVASIGLAVAAAVWGPLRPSYYPSLALAVDPLVLAGVAAVLVLPAWLVLGVGRSST